MPRYIPTFSRALVATFVICAMAATHAAESCGDACVSEAEPYLDSTSLVQPALLSGPNFKVVPEVRVRGFMASFLIDTAFGPLYADSAEMLAVRVAEIPALETLDRASRTGAFARALAERGRKTGSAIANVAAHPIDTITGLPAGVARFLRKQLDTLTGRAQSLSDQTSRHALNRGDPYRAPAGPMTAGRNSGPEENPDREQKTSRAWYARAGSETAREAKRYLKYSQQRRAMARALEVDPNSTNPILNAMLDTLAWAAVGGNFSAGAALAEITGPAAAVISYTGKANQYILEVEPEQLRETLRVRLLKRCSDEDSIRSFLRRGGFTDTLRVALVDALDKLAPADGCNDLIELAATTRGEVEARYLVDALKLLLQRRVEESGGRLAVIGAAVAWRTDAGKLVLPLPVDYLSWSHDIDDFVDQRDFAVTNKTVLIAGDASPLAQSRLTDRGWSLVLRAPYDGAPVYAAGDMRRLR